VERDLSGKEQSTSGVADCPEDSLLDCADAKTAVPQVIGSVGPETIEGFEEALEAERGRDFPAIVRSLRHEDFRRFWTGNFLSNIGTWMQNVAQGWLVLQLTNSSFWLGFIGFAASFPFLVVTMFGGVIADRVNRRRLLLVTQSVMMVLAFVMAYLTWRHIITVKWLAVLAFLNGVAMALNAPSYQAMVPQLVPREDLPNAIALNSAQFNLSRVLGPTLGGYAMAAFGIAGNFFLNGLSFLAVLFAIAKIRYPLPTPRRAESVWNSLREGFRYVNRVKEMRAVVLLIMVGSFFLLPFLTFIPYFAKNAVHADERGLGLLMACSGLGAFISAASVAYVGKIRERGRVIVISGLIGSAAVITICYAHSFALFAAMQLVEGAALVLMVSTVNITVQQLSSDEMRGRANSLYATAFLGLPPIGALLAGELSRHMPASHAIAAMAGTAMVSFVIFYATSKPLQQLD
jgi:MFS family permease